MKAVYALVALLGFSSFGYSQQPVYYYPQPVYYSQPVYYYYAPPAPSYVEPLPPLGPGEYYDSGYLYWRNWEMRTGRRLPQNDHFSPMERRNIIIHRYNRDY